MFNYLFPIFCFGLVITGIVFLGIMEASKQAKAQTLTVRDRETSEEDPALVRGRNGRAARITVPSTHD